MKTSYYLIIITALFICFSSCKKNNEQPEIYLGYNYFPVNVGHELIYNVDSTVTDDFFNPPVTTTYRFQIKEIIESDFIDDEGRPSQRIERYRRDSMNMNWVIYRVYAATRTVTRAERFEDNIRYFKMVFPVSNNVSWNGNSLNTFDPQEYVYTDAHVPFTINNLSFDSTATVLQLDDENAIERKYYTEQYATNVGMIYKENINLEIDFNNTTVKKGFIYKETLISYTP